MAGLLRLGVRLGLEPLIDVCGVVDALDRDLVVDDVDLVQSARVLRQPPVGRQRLVEQLQQDCPVDAVMAHHDHGVAGMAVQHQAQHIAGPRQQVLQRFAVGKAHALRQGLPSTIGLRHLGLDLGVGAHLPGAVVDIHQPVQRLGLDAARFGDQRAGSHAALQRAGVDHDRLPACRNALGERCRLDEALLGQRELSAAAKALGPDAFDMAMPGQQDLGHGCRLSSTSQAPATKDRAARYRTRSPFDAFRERSMLKPLSKPLVTLALLTAVSAAGAQAQTTPPSGDARQSPSVALQTTAPTGADARKLLGRNIKTMQNETIGEIKSIHLDQNGKVDAVIASVGGFLGLGEREVLLDWRDLQIDANGEVVRVSMTRDQLKAKPPYAYSDKSLRGTVFTDKGVWAPDRASRE